MGPGGARREAAGDAVALQAPSGRYDPGPAPRRRPRPGRAREVRAAAPPRPAHTRGRLTNPEASSRRGFAARTVPVVPPRHVQPGGRRGAGPWRGRVRDWGPVAGGGGVGMAEKGRGGEEGARAGGGRLGSYPARPGSSPEWRRAWAAEIRSHLLRPRGVFPQKERTVQATLTADPVPLALSVSCAY